MNIRQCEELRRIRKQTMQTESGSKGYFVQEIQGRPLYEGAI